MKYENERTLKKVKKKISRYKTFNIVFLEPDNIHPNSATESVANIALYIESKYHLIEKFVNMYQSKLVERAIKVYDSPKFEIALTEWIKNEWRSFMVAQLHGIQTKLALKQDRESFIDTGAYYRSLQVTIQFQ